MTPSVRGRVLTQDGRPTRVTSAHRSLQAGRQPGWPQDRGVNDGSDFVFDALTSGEYLLMIERPNFASCSRPSPCSICRPSPEAHQELQGTPNGGPGIRLKGNESASFREVVKAYGSRGAGSQGTGASLQPLGSQSRREVQKNRQGCGPGLLEGIGGSRQGGPTQSHSAPPEGRAGNASTGAISSRPTGQQRAHSR